MAARLPNAGPTRSSAGVISFSLDGTGDGVTLEGPELIVIGFSGRDGALVERHISELAALGVPRPPQVPMVWKLPSRLLLQGDHVTVDSDATSGEAEPVLIVRGKDHFLAVGSDHTDRELERMSRPIRTAR